MKTILNQMLRIGAWASQGVNTVLFAGHQNQTLSSRSYVNKDESEFWSLMYMLINGIFFWQKDHCESSHTQDIIWAEEYITYHKNTKTPK